MNEQVLNTNKTWQIAPTYSLRLAGDSRNAATVSEITRKLRVLKLRLLVITGDSVNGGAD